MRHNLHRACGSGALCQIDREWRAPSANQLASALRAHSRDPLVWRRGTPASCLFDPALRCGCLNRARATRAFPYSKRDARHVTRNGTLSWPGIQPIPHCCKVLLLLSYTRTRLHTRHGWTATWGTVNPRLHALAASRDDGTQTPGTRGAPVGAPCCESRHVGTGARPCARRARARRRVPADSAPAGDG